MIPVYNTSIMFAQRIQDGIHRMNMRIKNDISDKARIQIRERFKAFIKACGGAALVSKDTEFSYGYLRGTLGNASRVPSPRMIHILAEHYADEVDKKFTREYLRPDVLPAQWRVLVAEIEAKKQAE